MTPESLSFDGGELYEIEVLVEEILAVDGIEGLTISGGEPFAQAAALVHLLASLRAKRDLGVIVYSGYRLAQLQKMARKDNDINSLLATTDLLVDGLYVEKFNQDKSIKGSDNQQVRLLTQRYCDQLHLYHQEQSRSIEIHADIGRRMLVGLPSQKQLHWWRQQKL